MTAIITVAIVFVVAVAVSAIYSADKRKNQGVEVMVPEGETHIVRRSDGIISKEKGQYRRYEGDKVIVLKGSDTNFVVRKDDCFVLCVYGGTLVKIKVNVSAHLEGVDFKKMFSRIMDLMPYLEGCLKNVAANACHHTDLKSLLEFGIRDVISDDAIKEGQDYFAEVGVRLKNFTVSDVRDAYGKTVVAEMRKRVGTTEKNPHYPSLEEAISPELDQFLRDDPYPLVLNG